MSATAPPRDPRRATGALGGSHLFPGASSRRVAPALAVAGALLVAAGRSRAAAWETIGGWEGDTRNQGYGFAAVGVLMPAAKPLTFAIRGTGSFLYYRYDSTGTTLSVRSPGAALIAGARVAGARASASLMAGGEVRWDHRVADLPGSPARDQTTGGVVVQADADIGIATGWRVLLLGNYAGAARYLYGRGALRDQLTNRDWRGPTSFFVGLEGVGQGNDESDAVQGGAFVEWNLVPLHASLGLHGGYKESWSPRQSHHHDGYTSVSLYRSF